MGCNARPILRDARKSALLRMRSERVARDDPRLARALSVRLALRIDDLLELAEHVHARQHLLKAAVRLALLLDRLDELAVLELDAVHRHVHLRYVDLVVLAVAEIVVECIEGAVVADVAEERTERAVVVERQ